MALAAAGGIDRDGTIEGAAEADPEGAPEAEAEPEGTTEAEAEPEGTTEAEAEAEPEAAAGAGFALTRCWARTKTEMMLSVFIFEVSF